MLYVRLIIPIIPQARSMPIQRMLKPFMLFVMCPNTCSTRARMLDFFRLLSIWRFVSGLLTIEIPTLKQLKEHDKPVVFLNINSFYDKLIELFELFYAERFAKESFRHLYQVCSSVGETFDYLSSYEPQDPIQKWF